MISKTLDRTEEMEGKEKEIEDQKLDDAIVAKIRDFDRRDAAEEAAKEAAEVKKTSLNQDDIEAYVFNA